MERRNFIKTSALAGAGLLFTQNVFAKNLFSRDFPVVRVPKEKRHFTSESVESAIAAFKKKVKNKELSWLLKTASRIHWILPFSIAKPTEHLILMLLQEILMPCGFVTVLHRFFLICSSQRKMKSSTD